MFVEINRFVRKVDVGIGIDESSSVLSKDKTVISIIFLPFREINMIL